MLGLGDVVIPGTFVALALRYDFYRSVQTRSPFKKPYFYAALTAYVLGLCMSFLGLNLFGSAQPALLYLRCVPDFVLLL